MNTTEPQTKPLIGQSLSNVGLGGEPQNERQPLNVRCGACGHGWTAAYTPMEMMRLTKVLKGIHCPACGEPSKNIFLHHEENSAVSGVGSSDGLYVSLPPMPAGAFETTVRWLDSREADIALNIEDFGDLAELFKALVGRKPRF